MLNRLRIWIETGFMGLLGSYCFFMIHFPLAWLLGSVVTIMIWRFGTRRDLNWPSSLRGVSQAMLGYMLGCSFTGARLSHISGQIPYMAVTTVVTVMIGLACGAWISKRVRMDMVNGIFGSIPGGLNHIIALSSEAKGMDTTVVIFMQTIRSLTVIVMVPFITFHLLASPSGDPAAVIQTSGKFSTYVIFTSVVFAGYWLGKKMKLPGSSLTGPLLCTIIAICIGADPPSLPYPLLVCAQVCIGIQVGLQMKPGNLLNMSKIGMYTVTSSVILVIGSLFTAYLLTLLTPLDWATAFLCTAPGGIAEMGVTAAFVHADLSVVCSYQMFRLFTVIFVIIPLVQLWMKRTLSRHMIEQN